MGDFRSCPKASLEGQIDGNEGEKIIEGTILSDEDR